MAASQVPVIYDQTTKQVRRWYVLDFDNQLTDPAFGPSNVYEKVLMIPMSTYRLFGNATISGQVIAALNDLQNYVNANAP